MGDWKINGHVYTHSKSNRNMQKRLANEQTNKIFNIEINNSNKTVNSSLKKKSGQIN